MTFRCLIVLAYFLGGLSHATPPSEAPSAIGQCNIRLQIPEPLNGDAVVTEEGTATLQGRGPLSPFIIAIDGRPLTPEPIISGCFDTQLNLASPLPERDNYVKVLLEPL